MKNRLPWNDLIALAQRETDAAAQALGHAIARHAEARAQLDMLNRYRDEYLDTLDASAQQGVSIASLNNRRAFIDRLEAVIGQQRSAVEQAEAAVGRCQKAWQQRHARLKSFDTLAAREADAHARQHARQEQRQTDEFAAQAHRRNPQP
jgi:flagellar FliJ protein